MTNSGPGLGWPEDAAPQAGSPDPVAWAYQAVSTHTPDKPVDSSLPTRTALPDRYARRAARVGIGWPGGSADAPDGTAERAQRSHPTSGESGGADSNLAYRVSEPALGSDEAVESDAALGWGSDDDAAPFRVRQALAHVSRETVSGPADPARGPRPGATSDSPAHGAGAGSGGAPASESEEKVVLPAMPQASADTPIARAAQAAVVARSGGEKWPRPSACRVITIANQKGGVGKTTTAVNLAASLAMHGGRVLVVDLDPQGNASTALDVEHHSGIQSVYNVLVDGEPLSAIVRPVAGFPHLYCAPAAIDLAGAEIELVPLVARESRLARALDGYDATNLDYIFIDCPPSLGLLTVNALVAAPEVLIPIQCEYYALEGLEQLLQTVELVRSHLNPVLSVTTILLTMYDGRTRLASQVADEVRDHFGAVVLGSVIPRSVRVSEAPSYGQSVMTYDPGSTGALAYLEAARELAYRSTQSLAR
jgi:chromosome partitioning protein